VPVPDSGAEVPTWIDVLLWDAIWRSEGA
jgi:hypothetical protein